MSAAALRDPRPTSFAELAGQSYRASVAADGRDIRLVSSQETSVPREAVWSGEMQKNLPVRRNMFVPAKEDFRTRQAKALSRRLECTGLTPKMLAYALGVHRDTVLNWMRGECTMDGAAIEAVDRFFQSAGDWSFFAEIYGDFTARRLKRAEELEREAAEIRRVAMLGTVS